MPLYILLAGVIATIYSAFGGIRAVAFTDVLQFFAFGCIIPLIGFLVWGEFYNGDLSISKAALDPKFNLVKIFSVDNPKMFGMIIMLIYFTIPSFSAPAFQRIAIGSSIKQVRKAFLIAGIFMILIKVLIAWIPFLLYSINPKLHNDALLGYIIDTFSYTGLKGLIIIAIIAFAMSTADSRINSASVLFTNDIYRYFKNDIKNEIFISRLFAFVLGGGAITPSLFEADILGIIVLANSFYYPIVTPLFLLTIFGFRSSPKSVLIGMGAALFVTITWKFLPIQFNHLPQKMIGVLVAMLCNVVFLMGSHYLLRQPGGWVGIKDRAYLDEQKYLRGKRWDDFIDSVYGFNLITYCKRYVSKQNSVYIYFAIFCMIMTYTTMFMTPSINLLLDDHLLMFSYASVLLISLGFIISLSFAPELKKKNSLRSYGF